MSLNSSDSHNAFYVERDITSWYQDGSLYDRIAGTNGYDEMEGLFPGCYFDMSRNITAPSAGGGTKTGEKRIQIAGINIYYNAGDAASIDPEHGIVKAGNFNHLVCVPALHFGTSKMNSTDTAVGGYLASFMNTNIIGPVVTTGNVAGTINQQLYAEFGPHLKALQFRVSSTMSENTPNRTHDTNSLGGCKTWGAASFQAILMNEIEVYGSIVYSPSGYDAGNGIRQLPLFYLKGADQHPFPRFDFWLRDAISINRFAAYDYAGYARSYLANFQYGVRPRFILA